MAIDCMIKTAFVKETNIDKKFKLLTARSQLHKIAHNGYNFY